MNKRPPLLKFLPARLRLWVYYRHYRQRHDEWRDLFSMATLSDCPSVTMYDLVPGDEISGSIAFTGFYEWALTKQLAQDARRGGLLVDVGANMGYFALLWAGVSTTGRVVAFEAAPRNVTLLTNNVRRNHYEDRVTVVPQAAGDRKCEMTFDTGPAEQTGWGGIAVGLPQNSIVVPMVRLDEQLPDAEIDVLKIDTEGADALVLFGCERLLKARRIRTIYFEDNPDKRRRIGVKERAAQDFLERMNYKCHSFQGSKSEWCAHPA